MFEPHAHGEVDLVLLERLDCTGRRQMHDVESHMWRFLANPVQERREQEQLKEVGYEQTVLAAFRDIEEALRALALERARRAALEQTLVVHHKAFDRVKEFRRHGLSSSLDVLDVELSLYAAEDSLALSGLGQIQTTIGLFKAFCGGWQGVDFGGEAAGPSTQQAQRISP